MVLIPGRIYPIQCNDIIHCHIRLHIRMRLCSSGGSNRLWTHRSRRVTLNKSISIYDSTSVNGDLICGNDRPCWDIGRAVSSTCHQGMGVSRHLRLDQRDVFCPGTLTLHIGGQSGTLSHTDSTSSTKVW